MLIPLAISTAVSLVIGFGAGYFYAQPSAKSPDGPGAAASSDHGNKPMPNHE